MAAELRRGLNRGELEPAWNQKHRRILKPSARATPHILINSPASGQSINTRRDLSRMIARPSSHPVRRIIVVDRGVVEPTWSQASGVTGPPAAALNESSGATLSVPSPFPPARRTAHVVGSATRSAIG
jgi:hypothetical protein